MRHLLRSKLSLLATGILVMLASVAIWKPHIEVTEVRATSTPQTVQVMWYLECEADYFEDSRNQRYLPNIPVGGEEPYIGPVAMPGTRFVLIGYPYVALNRNRFTGKVEEQRSERFDVIEWHVVTPYVISNGENEIESSEPRGWKTEEVAARFTSKVEQPHRGC